MQARHRGVVLSENIRGMFEEDIVVSSFEATLSGLKAGESMTSWVRRYARSLYEDRGGDGGNDGNNEDE